MAKLNIFGAKFGHIAENASDHQFLKHIKPYVYEKLLGNITLMVAGGYKNARKKQGAANATVNRERSFLKAVLNKAVRWGVIEKNPLQYMEPLPESHLLKDTSRPRRPSR